MIRNVSILELFLVIVFGFMLGFATAKFVEYCEKNPVVEQEVPAAPSTPVFQ